MALQSNVLENGAWVTRNIEPRDLFRQTSSGSHQAKAKKQPAMPPNYGILTKTVIDSPVVHWVLPVQLRSTRHYDVAFIGDNFVQICELGQDVQLEDVARKQDFGSRIRNARVIGTPSIYTETKTEEDDIEMVDPADTHGGQLPPQLLAVVLEDGKLVFLYIKKSASGELEFVSHYEEIPNSRLVCPGFHMAVDPSSRYLVLACSESLFLLFMLESMETLRARTSERKPLKPVRAIQPRALKGVIHKIEFLYPGPDNDRIVILMMIIIHQGVSRLATYEWEQGEDMKMIFSEDKIGYRLDPRWQMPLLVIPSTVRYSFFLVTESDTAVWFNMRAGTPEPQTFPLEDHEATDLHIGSERPLWTAWSRPSRLPSYHADNDVIYLAREDGILNFLEIKAEEGLTTGVNLGEVKCNIDTAFACLYELSVDILVTGGDSGPGAVWNVAARERAKKIGTIPNWSPTVDFTTTRGDSKARSSRSRPRANAEGNQQRKPDKIFACSGRGKTGSIAEYRHGLEAKVALELECGLPIRQCWAMPCPGNSGKKAEDKETHLLLALPNESLVLHVTGNLSQATVKGQEDVPYDLASSTLATQELDDTIIQVTTGSVTIITPTESTRHLSHEIGDGSTVTITDAAIQNGRVALALHGGSRFEVKTLIIDGLNLVGGIAFDVDGEVTCLALGKLAGDTVMIVGVWQSGRPLLVLYPTHPPQDQRPQPIILDPLRLRREEDADTVIEALTSIVAFNDSPDAITLSVGTRSGEVFTLTIESTMPQHFQGSCDKFGLSGAHVFPLGFHTEPRSLLVCCDSGLTVMRSYSAGPKIGFGERFRVWPTDPATPAAPSPAFDSITRMPRNLSDSSGKPTLVMVAGTKLYISQLQSFPKPVLRHLPVRGTPVKVMYLHRLDVLVVAISEDGRPSLRFIDPETGKDLSHPSDSRGTAVSHISGLGQEGAKIMALTDWTYQKGGQTWGYIVVATRTAGDQGHVLFVTADKDESTVSEGGPPNIRFYTRMRRTYNAPIWSIATEAQGLFVCTGDTIHYEVLDLEEKRFRSKKEHELSSAAAWMEVVDGNLHAVTIKHSLEVLDYKSNPDDDAMTRIHSDDHAKNTFHSIEAVEPSVNKANQPVTLLADMYSGVWGLWVPPQDDKPLKTVFEAELPASVRRFSRARARPQWDFFTRKTMYGSIPSSADGADTLGLGIDGSLHHFTVLHIDAWRLLRFIQNLALISQDIHPSAGSYVSDDMDVDLVPEPQTLPVMGMQVDGDMLQRCLDNRALEDLVSRPECVVRFRQLLEALEEGRYTRLIPEPQATADYFSLAYDILSYYLAPPL
ncbi:thermotolerance protein [Xylariales sp. AK1849]|nr:thermotolerance protein [Xylariales sp. AK1849]